MTRTKGLICVFSFLMLVMSGFVLAVTSTGTATFSNTPLLRPDGGSEPELRIRADGTIAIVGLSSEEFVTHLWSAPFGGTPTFRGEVDSALQISGQRKVFGGGDADVDLASTGTLHATTLIFLTRQRLPRPNLGFPQSPVRHLLCRFQSFRVGASHKSSIRLVPIAVGSHPTVPMFIFRTMMLATAL